MVDAYLDQIKRVVKSYDHCLVAERSRLGMVVVYRHDPMIGKRQQVFALTDNWTVMGEPRCWGSEVVLARLQKHDLSASKRLFAELEKEDELREEQKVKARHEKHEELADRMHRDFKDSFKDTLVHSLDKSEKRRRNYEESGKFKS